MDDEEFGLLLVGGALVVFVGLGSFVGQKVSADSGAVIGGFLGFCFFLRAALAVTASAETVSRHETSDEPSKGLRGYARRRSGILLWVAFPLTVYFGIGTALYMLVDRLQMLVEKLASASSAKWMDGYSPIHLQRKSMWLTLLFPVFAPGFIVFDAAVLIPYCLLWLSWREIVRAAKAIHRSVTEVWQQTVDSLKSD